MAPRSRARKRQRTIAIACGDSLNIFVAMERAYLSENCHDHDFLVANTRRRALTGLLVLTLPGPQGQQRAQLTLVTPYARRCWMWRRPPDAVVGLGIPAHRGGRP